MIWIAVAIAAAVLLVIGVMIAGIWTELADAEMSAAGWGALVLGVVLTLALGLGLMSLVFISNRRGYDERSDHRR
ncbi:MAG: hypothetical protein AB7H90_06110 [Alphaproteobacteria bacterium]